MKTILLLIVSFVILDVFAWFLGWDWIMISMFEVSTTSDFFRYISRYPIAICIYFLLNGIYGLFAGRQHEVSGAGS